MFIIARFHVFCRPRKQKKTAFLPLFLMEQMRGIGPPYAAWKAAVLPLNYICIRDSEETRTLDPLIKSQLLYHLSYRVIRDKAP